LNQQATVNPDIHVLEQLFAIGRRRWLIVAAFAILGLLLGYAYSQSQVPVYATSATVMVRSGPAVDPLRQGIETSTPEEEGQFLSQLELARSATVAKSVADRLGLTEDEAFAKGGLSRLDRLVLRLTGRAQAKAEPLSDDAVIGRLMSGVRVLRVGRTYVAAISYSHADPAVAQKVAQAFAEAFRQKIAQENDVANSRLRATLTSEIDRATGAEKEVLTARLREVMLSRALPGMDVVIMNDARRPAAPISPRASFLAAVGLIIGAVIGCALAGLRDLTDRGVRDGDVLARATGARFLGYIPRRATKTGVEITLGKGQPLPDAARRTTLDPHSAFGETVRAIGVSMTAASATDRGRVTALTPVLPGEGTSILAANIATHLASLGRNVLLIDGDSRDARLSRWLGAAAEHGIVDAALQGKLLAECVLYDSKTNLSLLPMVTGADRVVEPSALLSSPRAAAFFETLRDQYQDIIVDLAPLAKAADARAATSFVDGYVVTVPWGRATSQLVTDILDSEPEVRAKLLGLVMTRTDLGKLPLYAAAGSRASFQRRVSRG
jgi:Mrp family chromosome partitioning ATPase/capsular polysaccharide biosynthesis protein